MRSVRLLTALAALAATRAAAGPSFVVERRTDDGTRETRVHHGDLTAVDSWAQESLLLRQVSDGRRLLQAVLRDGRLSQCEMLRDAESLERFFDDFSADFECARGANGTTGCLGVRIFRDVEDLDERQQELLQWRRLARACRRLQRGEDGGGGGGRRRRRDLFLYPGTNWCGSGARRASSTSWARIRAPTAAAASTTTARSPSRRSRGSSTCSTTGCTRSATASATRGQ
ncbi:hypothetical protein V5799_006506 [Amblyomma americanum]|uniref:Secreted protein n=1 Tax=Amblyomma americanum TaxID=6943 RepID=A0AAQ4DW67_AMBAM